MEFFCCHYLAYSDMAYYYSRVFHFFLLRLIEFAIDIKVLCVIKIVKIVNVNDSEKKILYCFTVELHAVSIPVCFQR